SQNNIDFGKIKHKKHETKNNSWKLENESKHRFR
ncbi:MAG: hypothetical protein ACJA19_001864, partial [Bacteroidia bacterium]